MALMCSYSNLYSSGTISTPRSLNSSSRLGPKGVFTPNAIAREMRICRAVARILKRDDIVKSASLRHRERAHYTTTTLLLLSSTMAKITTISALYLLWKSETRVRAKRCRRFWVHDLIVRPIELDEFH